MVVSTPPPLWLVGGTFYILVIYWLILEGPSGCSGSLLGSRIVFVVLHWVFQTHFMESMSNLWYSRTLAPFASLPRRSLETYPHSTLLKERCIASSAVLRDYTSKRLFTINLQLLAWIQSIRDSTLEGTEKLQENPSFPFYERFSDLSNRVEKELSSWEKYLRQFHDSWRAGHLV